ncbi:MAG: C4-type zinc ribbon domain-containing protein [bacterium]|nr:C4-type zinc ribbon domain-containing protein [bacterium]
MTELENDIKLLVNVQDLDEQIKNLDTEIKRIPKEMDAHYRSFKAKKDELAVLESEFVEIQKNRKLKEVELDSGTEAIKKYKTQQYSVKTNKEYTSLQHEIEQIQEKNSILEDEILSLMEQSDVAHENIEKKAEEIKLENGKLEQEEQDNKKKVDQIEQELQKRQEDRKNLVSAISDAIVAKYERIRDLKNGVGIVNISDGTCGGCHMELPPQIINNTKAGNGVAVCERCSRILYIKENN